MDFVKLRGEPDLCEEFHLQRRAGQRRQSNRTGVLILQRLLVADLPNPRRSEGERVNLPAVDELRSPGVYLRAAIAGDESVPLAHPAIIAFKRARDGVTICATTSAGSEVG